MSLRMLPRDHEAGNRKENIDTGESAAKYAHAIVEKNNRQNRNGSQSIDVVSVFQKYSTKIVRIMLTLSVKPATTLRFGNQRVAAPA